jgi:hypothetical protein
MNFNDLILILDNRSETIKQLASMELPYEIDEYGNEFYKTKDGYRVEDANGTKEWYVNDKRHRLDGPAIERADGDKYWFVNGKLHRTDGPAVERADGSKFWFVNDKIMTAVEFNRWRAKHNPIKESRLDIIKQLASMEIPHIVDHGGNEYYNTKDGYRVEYVDGDKAWFANGNYHRLDGPAVEWADGTKMWYINGRRHRVDGPAVEGANGTKTWWVEGKRHRLDGPAVESADGYKEWWVNDENMTEDEFNKWRAKHNPIK